VKTEADKNRQSTASRILDDVFDTPHSSVGKSLKSLGLGQAPQAQLGTYGSVVVQSYGEEAPPPLKQGISASETGEKPCREKPPEELSKDYSKVRSSRRDLHALTRGSAELTNFMYKGKINPVYACRWFLQHDKESVEVMVAQGDEQGSCYQGLQNCGSVWLCPVCAAKASEIRRQELNELLAWAREHGHTPVMVTSTCRHKKRDSLEAQLEGMKEARRKMRQWRKWRDVRGKFGLMSVTATEVTYGFHGWHVHFHEIFIIENIDDFSITDTMSNEELKEHNREVKRLQRKGLFDHEIDDALRITDRTSEFTRTRKPEDLAVAVMDSLGGEWITALDKCGLNGVRRYAWDTQDASVAGNYVAKWGAAEEMTLASKKYGKKGRAEERLDALPADERERALATIDQLEERQDRRADERAKDASRNPRELLIDAVVYGDVEAKALYQTYAQAFKGRMQLTWSRGLKDRVGLNEIDDEEAAQDDAAEMMPLLRIHRAMWTFAKFRRIRILDVAETTKDAKLTEEVALYGDRDFSYVDEGPISVIDDDDIAVKPQTVDPPPPAETFDLDDIPW